MHSPCSSCDISLAGEIVGGGGGILELGEEEEKFEY